MTIKDESLTPDQLAVLREAATERPFSSTLNHGAKPGTYLCRACGLALFRTAAQFDAGCGWPSFDETVADAIVARQDKDGMRTELCCSRCLSHLGHVFDGEGFTVKNKRYCINAKSLDFVENMQIVDTEEAIVAGGCFWGLAYYLATIPGVLATEVGYTGGTLPFPTYQAVCTGQTGHFEAVRVIFDPTTISYEAILRYFFVTHDPSQTDGQGPDIGPQYRSAIFYYDDQQKKTAQQLLNALTKKSHVATQLLPVRPFWKAEPEHQAYYARNGKQPYCHRNPLLHDQTK